MLTINNLDKIVRYQIDTFRVKSMICGIAFYHISLIDGKGQHRDLRLNRNKGKYNLYTISYGNYVYHLDFAEIKDMDAFCAQIKKLIC
jgi:hypothetical protein